MRQINLLPWREQARAERKRQFTNILGISIFGTICLVLIIHLLYANKIANQNAVNDLFQQEITRLNQQLTLVETLKKQQQSLIERINLIDKLQADRPQTVQIFTDMVNQIPDGVYLTNLKRVGQTITIIGKAESNARISLFIRNLEKLKWIEQVNLSHIQTEQIVGSYDNEFVLEINLPTKDVPEPTTTNSIKTK